MCVTNPCSDCYKTEPNTMLQPCGKKLKNKVLSWVYYDDMKDLSNGLGWALIILTNAVHVIMVNLYKHYVFMRG